MAFEFPFATRPDASPLGPGFRPGASPWLGSGFPGPGRPPSGAFPLPPGAHWPTGTVLAGRYRVEAPLSESACGFVYAARELAGDRRRMVVKAFDRRRGHRRDEELFRREANLLRRLEHPRIPAGGELFEHQGLLCSVQAFVDGLEVAQDVDEGGPWLEPAVVHLLDQVLDVLVYLHGRTPRVVHRDLKPANLLFDDQDRVWVLDLGVAAEGPPRDKAHGDVHRFTAVQSVGFAAPEQLLGLEAYPATDLYQLGTCALFVLTGLNPVQLYDGLRGDYLWDRVPASDALRGWLQAVLAPAAGDRPATALDAKHRLAEATAACKPAT